MTIFLMKLIGSHFFLTAAASSPTRSLCGPTSTEFQFQDVGEGQLVNPSWCFDVNTTYLNKDKKGHASAPRALNPQISTVTFINNISMLYYGQLLPKLCFFMLSLRFNPKNRWIGMCKQSDDSGLLY